VHSKVQAIQLNGKFIATKRRDFQIDSILASIIKWLVHQGARYQLPDTNH